MNTVEDHPWVVLDHPWVVMNLENAVEDHPWVVTNLTNAVRARANAVPYFIEEPTGDMMRFVKLGDFLQPSDIVFGIRAHDIAGVAEQLLAETLPHHHFSPESVHRLINAVILREREISTNCGPAAIPHARDKSVRHFIGAIAANPDGVIEGSKEPKVIFAFLSPEPQRDEHLALLRSLSALARDTAVIDAIANAKSGDDVVALLKR
ncbi:MAG TPA: PTS sugar transporter subunit IIA [Thermoanaerobaculia bacterium]|nr:PTS sugar transporter subunit IIA [Thermoanaerobaculia bacterium]